jgi:hypothetical protein
MVAPGIACFVSLDCTFPETTDWANDDLAVKQKTNTNAHHK